MGIANLKNKRYLIILALATSSLIFFQNCSNYSASLEAVEGASSSNNLQMIADNSPALNDTAPNGITPNDVVPNDTIPTNVTPNNVVPNDTVSIEIDDVDPNEDDLHPDEIISSPINDETPNLITDEDSEQNSEDLEDNSDLDDDNDKVCHNRGRKNCEYRNRCNLLAEAGGTLKGFNVITLTEADEGKTLSSHGKTIYSYSGSSTLHLNAIKSSGNTVICGNISITNLQTNGNCHLFYTQVENAEINGNISTSVLDENGIEKEIDRKSGRDVKSCKVNSDALILPL